MPTLDNIIVLGRKPNIVQRLKRGLGQLFNQQYVLDTERGRYLNLNNKKNQIEFYVIILLIIVLLVQQML